MKQEKTKLSWADINTSNLQGQCFRYVPVHAVLDNNRDTDVLKVIRQTGNTVYCIECLSVNNNKVLVSSTKTIDNIIRHTSSLRQYDPITREEFDACYTPIKKEVEATVEEADFV